MQGRTLKRDGLRNAIWDVFARSMEGKWIVDRQQSDAFKVHHRENRVDPGCRSLCRRVDRS